MAKGYNDLTRSALIKLSEDFDADNNEMLLDYLKKKEENGECYEAILFEEKTAEHLDVLSGPPKVHTTNSNVDSVVRHAIDAVCAVTDTIKGIKELITA